MSVALFILQAKRMRPIILLSMACRAVKDSSILSHKRYGFREKVFERKMFVLIFSTTLSEIFLILIIIQRDIIINIHSSLCEVPVILVRF
jgi:hypothetical protein